MVVVCLVAGGLVRAAEPRVVFDIPRMENITIDGKADDWGDGGFRVEVMTPVSGQLQPADKGDAKFRLGWNDQGLLLMVSMKDDIEAKDSSGELASADYVEMHVADRLNSRNRYRVVVFPGHDPENPKKQRRIFDPFYSLRTLKLDLASQKVQGGYVLEAMLPWQNLWFKPVEGGEIGLQLCVNDCDGPGVQTKLAWYSGCEANLSESGMQRVRLSGKGSPSVVLSAIARARENKFFVSLLAEGSQVGKQVDISHPGGVLASGHLRSAGGRTVADMELPAWLLEGDWSALEIGIKGKPETKVILTPLILFGGTGHLAKWVTASSNWRSWSLEALAELSSKLPSGDSAPLASARFAIASHLKGRFLDEALNAEDASATAAFSRPIIDLASTAGVTTAWAKKLHSAFVPDGVPLASLSQWDVGELFTALSSLEDAALPDLVAGYVNATTAWQSWSPSALALRCLSYLKGESPAGMSARRRIADYVQAKYLADDASIKSVELYVWRLFAQSLGSDLDVERQKVWLRKLQGALANKPEEIGRMSAGTAFEFSAVLSLLGGRDKARDFARSWLKEHRVRAGSQPIVPTCRLMVVARIMSDPELASIMEDFEKAWTSGGRASRLSPVECEGAAKVWLYANNKEKAGEWAMRALAARLRTANVTGKQLAENARLLQSTGRTGKDISIEAYAEVLAGLARAGKISSDWHWTCYRDLAQLLGTGDTQQQLRAVLVDGEGYVRLGVARILSWSYRLTGGLDQWCTHVDSQINSSKGDKKALWLIARADAESAAAGSGHSMRGKKWLQEAIATAQSAACRIQAIESLVNVHFGAGEYEPALSYLASARGQFVNSPDEARIDALACVIREAKAKAEDRARRTAERSHRAHVSELERRLQAAGEKGDKEAIRRYERLVKQSKETGNNNR
jgi:hypothetical protein